MVCAEEQLGWFWLDYRKRLECCQSRQNPLLRPVGAGGQRLRAIAWAIEERP